MGKFIVIEGTDGAGKQTQTELLEQALKNAGYRVRKLSFPVYDSDSSALVKMYLNGTFGDDPNAVNRYAASAFYAVDRFASFKADWEKDYLDPNCVVLSDRYVGSNAMYQGEKCAGSELPNYLAWLDDFEFNKMGIPRPDMTLYLCVEPDIASRMMAERGNKISGKAEKDIHEKNPEYLIRCYRVGNTVAKLWGWTPVACTSNGQILPRECIAENVLAAVHPLLQT